MNGEGRMAEAASGLHGGLVKAPTGINGFDEITLGGLPAGRPTLVCGATGCGKTLFAMAFLVNGATQYNEPGVFLSFEERTEDLVANVASLGYDLDRLCGEDRLVIDHVRVERHEIEESGEYDLEGLFVRLGYAVDRIGAKRVVIDTIEVLFAGLSNTAVLRSELRRLFGWIKERGLTAIITGERGEGQLTRQGLEEYVSDCVILLDNRLHDQMTTRRLRVVKYRGSAHGTNEYPFLIDGQGISVFPVTSVGFGGRQSDEAAPTGIAGLDAMLGAGGIFRGSGILISGASGTGKTLLGAHFVAAACVRGERCLVMVFEEGPSQYCRNAKSVGLDLQSHIDQGLLRIESARPSLYGLETHLARMYRDVAVFEPGLVVIDPISALNGPAQEVQATMLRMVDMLRGRGITAVMTSLRNSTSMKESEEQDLSSLMDAWIRLKDEEANGERNRTLYVIKARGMSHSNQVREYRMTDKGIEIIDAYIGPEGVLTGSARTVQEAREQAALVLRRQEVERRQRDLKRRRTLVELQIAEMQAGLDAEEAEARSLASEEAVRETLAAHERDAMAARRSAAE
jgi:circadian clock protein KaiC